MTDRVSSAWPLPTPARRNPPAYVLTLRETPEREAVARAHFADAGLSPTFLHGVHGPSWGLRTTQAYNDDGKPGDYFISPGHVGLCLSWHTLWTHLWLTGAEEALCFEDDAILCPDFADEYAASRAALPEDWQIAYVGSCCIGDKPTRRVNDRIAVVEYPFCTHALLIRRSALPTLLECSTAWANVDILLARRALPKLRHYTFTPSLATQRTQAGEWVTLAGQP